MLSSVAHQLGKLAYPLFERFSSSAWDNAPRPAPRAVSRGPGHDPDRVLLTGGSSAVGWGVISHDLGLAGHLARATSAITGRGTDIEVHAYPRLDIPALQESLTQTVISRCDAIVLTLGGRESFELMPVRRWREQVTSLLDHIVAGREAGPGVLVVGAEEISPVPLGRLVTSIAMRRARAFNAATREIIATRPRVRYLLSRFAPPAGAGRRGVLDSDLTMVYDTAARAIAPTLAGMLDAAPDRVRRHVDDDARHDAIVQIRAHVNADDPQVMALLSALREVLGVYGTAVYLVDRDIVYRLASTLESVPDFDRERSISGEAIRHPAGYVVRDLAQEPRFADRAEVLLPPHLRFYAGHPVESPDGHPVAVLAVVDPEPRDITPTELAIVRTYAHRVGEVLFSSS